MSVTVRLPTPLRSAVGGERTIQVEASDLASLQREIAARYPELGARVLRDGAFGRRKSGRLRERPRHVVRRFR